MVESEVNPYPILLLVNFWEVRPSQLGSKLDELKRKGVMQFATFVPWQVVESDISHTFARFLQSVSERKMKVCLILSPEVGVHYPNSGLPKDVILRKENMAHDECGDLISVCLPPNSFYLPSYFAPDFSKRYHGYLGRLEVLFHDLSKTQPQVFKCLTVVLTGSFWKYYRASRFSSQSVFGGNGGDFSTHASLAYRQRLESFYCQKEFTDPSPVAANRWKTRSMEEINHRWFFQQSEDVFRNRTSSVLKRKGNSLNLVEVELSTPEADPALAYSNFLQMVSGGYADFSRLSSFIEEVSLRGALASGSRTLPFVHWTSMGGFKGLAEPEKQFLILKSLLLTGGQKGGVMLDEAEWFSLSLQFRNRVETLALSLLQGDFSLKSHVLYLTPHLWSNSGDLLDELVRRVGSGLKVVSTLDLVLRETFSRLLVVDPSFVLTREVIQKITAWARAGRVVVLPRSPLYTESARVELEQVLVYTKRIEVDLGMLYRLHALGDGKLIIYDMNDKLFVKGESLASLQSFVNAALSISEVENYCTVVGDGLKLVCLERKRGGVAVFVFNESRKQVTADIVFPTEVQISDLGAMLSGEGVDTRDLEGSRSSRFTLEVPPYGILPLHVEGLNLVEARERQLAALISKETRESAAAAAASELPGFNMKSTFGELWN